VLPHLQQPPRLLQKLLLLQKQPEKNNRMIL
jgi:hypothetical protein